jgi:hypothetical protein
LTGHSTFAINKISLLHAFLIRRRNIKNPLFSGAGSGLIEPMTRKEQWYGEKKYKRR